MNSESILIEAESFDHLGGWGLDTQFIHSMGSPYLIAHGLGEPVSPANTMFKLPSSGRWHVWARTKNWVPGNWDAPGRFKISVNDQELNHVFGADSENWDWECGGHVDVNAADIKISLIDLTGFDGRCDAVYLTMDENDIPDNSSEPMSEWRRSHAAIQETHDPEEYDLIVVGAGLAGISAAIAGARAGLQVALLHDRQVLGGNGSTEVRVACCGNYPAGNYPMLGDIVKDVTTPKATNAISINEFQNAENHRQEVISKEPTLSLFCNKYAYKSETEAGHIKAIWAMDTHGREIKRFNSKFFVDASGHGTLGLNAGADFEMQPGERMGTSNLWTWEFQEEPCEFPETPWALQVTQKGFPYPKHNSGEGSGDWYWESGFDKHPLKDLEHIRDHNLRAAFGAWNAIKNHGAYADKDKSGESHTKARLTWLAYIGGPRETLQLLGDVIVTKEDILANRDWPDACVPATWGIDLHYPMPLYLAESPDDPFISRAHFGGRVDDSSGELTKSPRHCVHAPAMAEYDKEAGYLFPYRSFYSRNIDNLFLAGRDVSVTHDALGTIRVQNTLGMVGVVVGRAASIACKHSTTPRGVYEDHLDELKNLLCKPGDYRA